MYRVRAQIGYQKAYAFGLTGKGVGIGVLDSGVFLHEDLTGRVIQFRDFVGAQYAEECFDGGSRQTPCTMAPYDDFGHGTHICGIIAGSGKVSGGRYRGLAPESRLYVGRVLDGSGDGRLRDMIRGMEWLLSIAAGEGISLINISVGSVRFQSRYEERRLLELFRRAYENGILVVVAAGNRGPKSGSISKLGDTVHTICVGCHDGAYYADNPYSCERYSGQGPGERVFLKPDLVAPGTHIVSCINAPRGYTAKSGTSMAAPIVTGSLALLMEQRPSATAYEYKKRLLTTLDDLGERYVKQGLGMLNLGRLLY